MSEMECCVKAGYKNACMKIKDMQIGANFYFRSLSGKCLISIPP